MTSQPSHSAPSRAHRDTTAPPWLATMALALACALAAPTPAGAADWPQWRGPDRDGVWAETGIRTNLPKGFIDAAWRAPIGEGYNGPTVAEGRVFVMDRVREPKSVEGVHAFDAKTGKPLWSLRYEASYEGIDYDNGPRAAVTIAEGTAFALGTMGHLHALDPATGAVRWKRHLGKDYGLNLPTWGLAAAPLVHGGVVLLQIGAEGAGVVGLDAKTGKERWRATGDRASYAAPILIQQAGRTLALVWTGVALHAIDPGTGAVAWSHETRPNRGINNSATPVVADGSIVLSSFFDGAWLLDFSPLAPAVNQRWRRRGMTPEKSDGLHAMITTPQLRGGHIYGVDGYGQLRCLDASTGERRWEDTTAVPQDRWGTAHLVQNGAHTWIFNERGELIVARLEPKGYTELGRAKLIEPTTFLPRRDGKVNWSHPAFAMRHVFARNDKELLAADLSGQRARPGP